MSKANTGAFINPEEITGTEQQRPKEEKLHRLGGVEGCHLFLFYVEV